MIRINKLEQEILRRVRELDADKQQCVLNFMAQLQVEKLLSAHDLIQLPPAERKSCVQASIESAADEDFEIFEAYTDEIE